MLLNGSLFCFASFSSLGLLGSVSDGSSGFGFVAAIEVA